MKEHTIIDRMVSRFISSIGNVIGSSLCKFNLQAYSSLYVNEFNILKNYKTKDFKFHNGH